MTYDYRHGTSYRKQCWIEKSRKSASSRTTQSKKERSGRKKSVVNYYTMKKQNGEPLTNILNIVFIELTHLDEKYGSEELERLSAAEKWALFLKNADNMNSSELVRNLTEKEDGIMNAQSVLSSISSDRGLWLAQYHAEVRERDRISNMEEAKALAKEEQSARCTGNFLGSALFCLRRCGIMHKKKMC